MNTVVDQPLPYTLKRPFFTFFRRYTVALVPLAVVLGLLGGAVAFLTTLITGSLVWLTFGFCLLMARYSITIYEDRLFFEIFGKQYTALYRDLCWVDVEFQVTYYSQYYRLWIAWRGAENQPLYVNFHLFGQKDRKILLRAIAACAPQAVLNDLAKEFAAAQ